MRIVLFIALFGMVLSCRAAEDYEQHVRNLAASTPIKQSEASFRSIKLGGVAAFPALIAHFSDPALVEERIMPPPVANPPPGYPRPYDFRMTLGYTCFTILQNEVEGGSWLKGYTQYHVLTRENAKQWLDARKSLTLLQLRQAALNESLQRAEADLGRAPGNEFYQGAVDFLRQRLAAAK